MMENDYESESNIIPENEFFRNGDDVEYSDIEILEDDDLDCGNSKDENEPLDEEDSNSNRHDFSDSDDEFSCTEIKSLGGTKTICWIPTVRKSIEPTKEMVFDTLDSGIAFYNYYAKKAGFDVRRGGTKHEDGILIHKYLLCSRSGTSEKKSVNTLNGGKGLSKRKRPSKMICCPAKIGFKKCEDDKFYINMFRNKHNHELYTKSTVHMSRTRRQLTFYDKTLIRQLGTSNIGATKAHAVATSLKGGYSQQGPTKVDYKNFSRDLNCRVGDSDANLVVTLLEGRQKNIPSFSFYYMLDEHEELRGLFWADGIAKRNYSEFSDIVSFDATFNTNKYDMVFVPFTGIDNHKRCVTFGAGLLAQETTEYYTWLLECLVKTFDKHPKIVVTDQDPAMAKAVATVLTDSIHRLCMWHISKKLTHKVSKKIIRETDFRKRLQALIWNHCIVPEFFEEKWRSLIDEFKLQDNKWLKHMYEIRESWIPAYFKDLPLSGLMRTTSRSESENYFFQSFMSRKSSLLLFMNKFDTAMDKQRNIQSHSEFNAISKTPPSATLLRFETQAARFYTPMIFSIFQKEAHDCAWSCSPVSAIHLEGYESCVVDEHRTYGDEKNRSVFFNASSNHFQTENKRIFKYQVKVFTHEDNYTCNCCVFEHYGILCRHILCILKGRFIKKIPDKFLLRRWQKGIIRVEELQKKYSIGEAVGGFDKNIQEAYSVFIESINMIGHDDAATAVFVEWQKEIRAKIQANPPDPDPRSKKEKLDAMIGVEIPEVLQIRNPTNIRNKGCGSSKRIKGKREIALENAKKDGRTCTFCNKKISPSEKHDRRNCPVRIALKNKKTLEDHSSEEDEDLDSEDLEDDDSEDEDEDSEDDDSEKEVSDSEDESINN